MKIAPAALFVISISAAAMQKPSTLPISDGKQQEAERFLSRLPYFNTVEECIDPITPYHDDHKFYKWGQVSWELCTINRIQNCKVRDAYDKKVKTERRINRAVEYALSKIPAEKKFFVYDQLYKKHVINPTGTPIVDALKALGYEAGSETMAVGLDGSPSASKILPRNKFLALIFNEECETVDKYLASNPEVNQFEFLDIRALKKGWLDGSEKDPSSMMKFLLNTYLGYVPNWFRLAYITQVQENDSLLTRAVKEFDLLGLKERAPYEDTHSLERALNLAMDIQVHICGLSWYERNEKIVKGAHAIQDFLRDLIKIRKNERS